MKGQKPRQYDSVLDRLRAEVVRAEAVVKALETRGKDTFQAECEVERRLEKLKQAEVEAAERWRSG